MRMIALNKDLTDYRRGMYNDTEEPGEGVEATAAVVRSAPVSINADAVRCCYPRKDNRAGTRITFTDGGGFPVIEPYEDVIQLLNARR